MSKLAPEQGVDRCPCGCKYWTPEGRCIDCGDRWVPDTCEGCGEPHDPAEGLCGQCAGGYETFEGALWRATAPRPFNY